MAPEILLFSFCFETQILHFLTSSDAADAADAKYPKGYILMSKALIRNKYINNYKSKEEPRP